MPCSVTDLMVNIDHLAQIRSLLFSNESERRVTAGARGGRVAFPVTVSITVSGDTVEPLRLTVALPGPCFLVQCRPA
jgi:hypothetical protein